MNHEIMNPIATPNIKLFNENPRIIILHAQFLHNTEPKQRFQLIKKTDKFT